MIAQVMFLENGAGPRNILAETLMGCLGKAFGGQWCKRMNMAQGGVYCHVSSVGFE